MKRGLTLSLAVLLVFVFTGIAFAQAKVTPLVAHESVCEILNPGKTWVSKDGIMHIRGQIRHNRVQSTEVRVDGWNTLVVHVNLDTQTGSGSVEGSFMIEPLAVDGTLEGTFSGQFTNFLVSGRAVAFGTGDLEGQKLSGTINDFVVDPSVRPCTAPPGTPYDHIQTLAVGQILQPNSK